MTAHALTFDFENLSQGSFASVSQTVSGLTVTVTPASGQLSAFNVDTSGGIPGLSGIALLDFFDGTGPMTANFSQAVDGVSITGGDFGQDEDNFFLNAFSGLNGTGTLLGSITVGPCCADVPGSAIASLGVSGVRSVQFYSLASDAYPGSLYFDNLTVRSVGSGTPEPASWALMLLGFGGLGAAARTRRRVAAAA